MDRRRIVVTPMPIACNRCNISGIRIRAHAARGRNKVRAPLTSRYGETQTFNATNVSNIDGRKLEKCCLDAGSFKCFFVLDYVRGR